MKEIIQFLSIHEKKAILILSVFYLFGIVFHLLPMTQTKIVKFTELTLIISNTIVFIYLTINNNRNFYLWFTLTILITLLIEIFGVYSGKIFGSYFYGQTMQLKISGVPIVIGINWAILILASFEISQRITQRTIIIPLLSGIIIVFFDMIMEPVAMNLDYWQWADNKIPFQNYFAWFLLTVLFSFLLLIMKVKTSTKILLVYFIMQFFFFAILNLFLD